MTKDEQQMANVAAIAKRRREKTHCDSGHEWTDENTGWKHNGHRVCLECKRERERLRAYRLGLEDIYGELVRQRARAEAWKQRALAKP